MSYDDPDFRRIIRDFSAGFLDTPESDTLPQGATPEARNGWFTDIHPTSEQRRATLSKRPGFRRMTTLEPFAALEHKIDQVFEFRRSGYSPLLCGIAGGELRTFDANGIWVPVSGGVAGFVPGYVPTVTVHRDEAYIHDGAARRRFDGVAVSTPDQIAPTAVTDMTAVAPAGVGVSGTFEALYTWYDEARDHESSPSPTTAEVVLVNQARQHTIPTGTPGASYTKWRAYVRRTDINETKFTRVLTLDVATLTAQEERIDIVRVDPAPFPNSNDPAPTDFVMTTDCQGYFVGFRMNGSDLYVSKFNQPQSYHPRDVFPVAQGDGESLTAVRNFGSDHWVFKAHATWRLMGDRAPFRIEHVHPSFGAVGPCSGAQVDSHFYDWDRERGPYRTDGQEWTALADGRVRKLVKRASKQSLWDVRFQHFETHGCVGWMFATDGQSRKRTLLLYSYLLDAWVPPWTGLEFASIAQFVNSASETAWVVGDEWGHTYEMFAGDRDGAIPAAGQVLAGTVAFGGDATLILAEVGTLVLTSDAIGLSAAWRNATTGEWQWRRIRSWSTNSITLDTVYNAPFSGVPQPGDLLVVAGIEWFQWTPWFDEGAPEFQKVFHWLYLQGRAIGPTHQISVFARFNHDEDTAEQTHNVEFATGSGAIWGAAIWNQSVWGGRARRAMLKKRLDKTAFAVQLAVMNFLPDQPFTITAFGFSGDALPEQRVPSA